MVTSVPFQSKTNDCALPFTLTTVPEGAALLLDDALALGAAVALLATLGVAELPAPPPQPAKETAAAAAASMMMMNPCR
jgi:hypothetical protein